MVAGGVLGWPPATVLASSLPELMLAVEGWKKARGIETGTPEKPPAMTRAELEALIQQDG